MNIVLTYTSDIPLYRQIYEQVRAQIMQGELESGYNLPPIRSAAKELRVSVITVKKAWEELERDGLIVTMVGRGCTVAPMLAKELDDKRHRLVREKMAKDIEEYRSIGLSKEDILNLVQQLYKE